MSDQNAFERDPKDDDQLDEFELACSACNADLAGDRLFQSHRVCSNCNRHFWIPARERIALLLDPGSFQETNAQLESIDPLHFHDRLPVADRIAEAREQPAVAEAAITGTGAIAQQPLVVIALDLAVLGAGIGIVAGEKIAQAIELAVGRRLPVLAICSGGSGRGQEGVLALAQIGKLASSVARLHRAGLPLIALLTHPTTGNVLVGLANQADFAFAEPGAHVELDAHRTPGSDEPGVSSDALIAGGAIDGMVPRGRQRDVFEQLLRLLGDRGTVAKSGDVPPAASVLRASDELSLIHRPQRPSARDYLERIVPELVELHGDRAAADAPGITGGIGRLCGITVVAFGVTRHEAGLSDQAFAKVNRLLRLASHLELPVVSFVETTGHGVTERSDAGLGMSLTLALLTATPAPVVCVVIGEVVGLRGITLLTADRVVMQEHAVISISPGEPVASARDCLRLGLVDAIVPEPDPAADVDPAGAADAVVTALASALAEVVAIGPRRLADDRMQRLRNLGLSTPEGREVAHVEWIELQEIQRRIGRSIDDLRYRWEHRQLTIPSLSNRSGSSARAMLSSRSGITLPKFTVRRPDLAELASRVQSTRIGMALREPVDHADPEGKPDDPE